MGLYGYTTRELAEEVMRRALGRPLSRNYSPDPSPQIQSCFVKIPDTGINGGFLASGTFAGKPGLTDCVKYEATGTDFTLEKSTDSTGADIIIEVMHFGRNIDGAALHTYPYVQCKRMRGGWVVDVEYCD